MNIFYVFNVIVKFTKNANIDITSLATDFNKYTFRRDKCKCHIVVHEICKLVTTKLDINYN